MIKTKPVERHKTAQTSVDVFRLFKMRDLAAACRASTDPIVKQLAAQIFDEATTMLSPYCEQQRYAK